MKQIKKIESANLNHFPTPVMLIVYTCSIGYSSMAAN